MRRHEQFIAIFDGIDGAGKNTLCKSVADYINKYKSESFILMYKDRADLRCIINSFPDYNSIVGNTIADMLNWKTLTIEQRKVLATLFAMERKQRPISQDLGVINIMDRYYPSNFAYNYEINDLDYLLNLEDGSYVGDIVFILDVDPKISFTRRPERRDSYEKDIKYLTNVREEYLKLAKKFGWIVLDGSVDTKTLTTFVIDRIMSVNHGLSYVEKA